MISTSLKPVLTIPEQLRLTHGECAFIESWRNGSFLKGTPSPTSLAWKPCTLPDAWELTHPDKGGDAWYRFSLPNTTNSEDKALFLASFMMNAEAWVNGKHIGSGGSFEEPIANNWNRPLFFHAPTYVLNKKGNTLVIHVRAYPNAGGGLGLAYWGSPTLLHPAYLNQNAIVHYLGIGVVSLSLLLGSIFGILYIATRQKSFLYFSIASFSSCLYVLDQFIISPPLTHLHWEIIVHSSLYVSQYFFLLFMIDCLQLTDRHIHWFKHFGTAHMIISIASILLCSEINVLPVSSFWHAVGLLWLLYFTMILYYKWIYSGNIMTALIACAIFFEGIFMLADWSAWINAQIIPPVIYPIGPMAFALVATVMLILRFIQGSRQEEAFRLELKESLVKQEIALKEKHDEVIQYEQQQSIRYEQERITRELHDGIGSHLLGAKSVLGSDKEIAKQLIGDALDELRALMDSLGNHSDLLTILGMMRQRMERRLQAQNITFDWQVWEIPEHMHQSPQVNHHVARIIQESIANIEKHAQATQITLRINQSGITVADNGIGFEEKHVPSGRGLTNMRWRAKQAGAKLIILSNTDRAGTSISLAWEA